MMTGNVLHRQAMLPVTFRLPGRPDLTIDFVVDTGFTGTLTLPVSAVAALTLPYVGSQSANLADDSEVQLAIHTATIVWNGVEQEIGLLATGKRPLLGTALLDGSELLIQFAINGLVTVDEL